MTREEKYWLDNCLTEYPRCGHCDEPLTSRNFIKNGPPGYRPFCGIKCAKLSQDYALSIARRKQTNLERYGSNNPWHFENFRRYVKERFGIEYVEQKSDQ